MKRLTIFSMLGLLLACSCARLSHREKTDLFLDFSGIKSLSAETLARLDLHCSGPEEIYRVVATLSPQEASAIRQRQRPADWRPGPIPDDIWKATVQLGGTRQPPGRFIPEYTNTMEYLHREVGAERHLYVLDRTQSDAPTLYYVYFNIQ